MNKRIWTHGSSVLVKEYLSLTFKKREKEKKKKRGRLNHQSRTGTFYMKPEYPVDWSIPMVHNVVPVT